MLLIKGLAIDSYNNIAAIIIWPVYMNVTRLGLVMDTISLTHVKLPMIVKLHGRITLWRLYGLLYIPVQCIAQLINYGLIMDCIESYQRMLLYSLH